MSRTSILDLINVQLNFYNKILIETPKENFIEFLELIYNSFEEYEEMGIKFIYNKDSNNISLLYFDKEKYMKYSNNYSSPRNG